MPQIRTVIVGAKHRGPEAIAACGRITKDAEITLSRDKENEFDRNAVACHHAGEFVGYLPRHSNAEVAEALERGCAVSAVCYLEPIMQGDDVKMVPKIQISWERDDDGR